MPFRKNGRGGKFRVGRCVTNPRPIRVSVAASLLRRGLPLACVVTTFVLCCCGQVSAENKALKGDLERALQGKTFVSTVVFGGKAVPRGYQTDYPVNTVVSPEGQVMYRVEWGLMRTDVGLNEMRQRFNRGTPFRIVSIDLKDDRLELKLESGSGGSARLKLMLGAGWQSKVDAAAGVQALSQVLVDQQQDEHAQQHSQPGGANVPATSAPPSFRTDQARVAAVPVTALYSRLAGAAGIPGRISENDVQNVLLGVERQKQFAQDGLRRSASSFSLAFQAFKSAYSRERGSQPVAEIDRLQGELGNDLIPRRPEDIDALDQAFGRCLYVAQLRRTGDEYGRQYGPGANSPAYQEAFLSRDAAGARVRATQDLRAAFARKESIASAETAIIHVEQALDKGDLLVANGGFGTLSGGTTSGLPEIAQYLAKSTNLRSDLAAYSQANATPAQTATSPVTTIHAVANEEAQLAAAVGKPLTSSYLQRRLDADKRSLREQLNALPAFHFDRNLYTTATVDRLTQLKGLLLSATDLAALMGDQTALDLTHSWYGDAMYASLNAKGKDIAEAQLLETKLENQIATEQRLRDQEQARKQALVDKRNSLASEIVNTTLMITMLEEKFQLTQVIGYSMEASKQKTNLSNLVRTNRPLLDHAVWNEVDQAFQRVLPGLTLWQANRAESILAELRR